MRSRSAAVGLALVVGCASEWRPPDPSARGPIAHENEPLVIDVGSAAAAYFGAGWGGDEGAPGARFRWSVGAASEVSFTFVRPAESDALLELRAYAYGPVAPATVAVELDGAALGEVVVGPSWGRHAVAVARERLGAGRHRITLRHARTASPASMSPGDGDRRELAVAYDEIRLLPTASATVDLGTAAARPALLDGWGADALDQGRSVVQVDAKATLAIELDPEPVPYLIEVMARTARPGAIAVSLDGTRVGRIEVPATWTDTELLIAPGVPRQGRNVIGLEVEGPTWIDRVRVAAAPRRLSLDVGTLEARAHLGVGWSEDDETSAARSATWSAGPSSEVHAFLHPQATPYRLIVEAIAIDAPSPLRAEVRLAGRSLGFLELPSDRWTVQTLDIPTGLLTTGDNRFELIWNRLVKPPGGDTRQLAAWVDRLYVLPAR